MTSSTATRHFLKDTDLSPAEQAEVLELAVRMKAAPYSVQPFAAEGNGRKTVAVIFDKTSTRTRVSFATGIADMGGNALIINPGEAQIGHKESVEDTAKVLERMVSTIVWRTGAHSGLVAMAENSKVPVINALCDDYHPCQLLADLLAVKEHKGELAGLSMAYLGDAANNMANSYLLAGVTAGMHVRIAGPEGYLPAPEIVAAAEERAAETGGSVLITSDAAEALKGADVVATDTWVSMGQEAEKEARMQLFRDYSVDEAAMEQAAPDAVVLHCLPAYRGYEISAGVIDGPQSIVWDEAENRLHAQKALMAWLMHRSGLAIVEGLSPVEGISGLENTVESTF
ncbi:ornithine carbamoyltransferase [Paenarthrobacter sp. TYUT067]|uniref:ornithine carbamoyltransferase n=1 Tax=Paenarthrobacter sp. TYUT067 TaxID=2926245 RepID=UPI00202F9B0F|nr:ornithine carbamoyltransferase [Paenarthrobacter sp. TYUT067]MCM0615228.1 ornithine carbamoyltransferase [Paenarthrobacter sp. TYUT067]